MKRLFLHLAAGLVAALPSLLIAQTDTGEEGQYTLNTGDSIQITVYQEEDLSLEVSLDESQQFSYPYLGRISAGGKTPNQLAHELRDGLRGDYLISPEVSVAIVKYRPFYIGGEVRSPGKYPYQPGLTVKQAIVIAGGETEWASSSRFRIQREGFSESERTSKDSIVNPGDTITVEAGLF